VQSHNGQAEVAIASAGFTLTDEQRAKLFDPFQAPGEKSSGLGLALVQALLRNLGGSVSGESRAAGGTVLRVRLPLAATLDHAVHDLGVSS
jgi:signal transduction histidine kinase